MSTALTVYERMSDPIHAIQVLGNAIAKSGMFGCGSVEGGQVFAMECLARRMPPLTLAERYHVIFNKLSMKAEAMLAGFEAVGGKYAILSRSPDGSCIEFTRASGEKHTLSLTWEDAQKEPFAYEGKEDAIVKALTAGKPPAFKPKYATPRSRMQMLWARLVSDSVRFLAPSVVCGVYTPEEIGDFEDEAIAGGNGHAANGNGSAKSASVVDQAEAAAKAGAIDVPFEVKQEQGAGEGKEPAGSQVPERATATPPAGGATSDTASNQPGKITAAQLSELNQLVVDLQAGEQINKALAKRGLGSKRELESADAAKIIATMRTKLAEVRAKQSQEADALAGKSTADAKQEQSPKPCGPATADQVKVLKQVYVECAQANPKIMEDVKAGMAAAGKKAFAELSANDAALLTDRLRIRNIGDFFQRSLETWEPTSPQPAAATTAA